MPEGETTSFEVHYCCIIDLLIYTVSEVVTVLLSTEWWYCRRRNVRRCRQYCRWRCRRWYRKGVDDVIGDDVISCCTCCLIKLIRIMTGADLTEDVRRRRRHQQWCRQRCRWWCQRRRRWYQIAPLSFRRWPAMKTKGRYCGLLIKPLNRYLSQLKLMTANTQYGIVSTQPPVVGIIIFVTMTKPGIWDLRTVH